MRIAIHVKPGSARTAVGGRRGPHGPRGPRGHGNGPDGPRGDALLVCVTARAVDGKATEAALAAVAEAFGVRRRDVSLVTGATSRDKVVEIEGVAADLAGRRDRLLGSAVTGDP